jgi:AcrR family transcriptional regulator
MKERILQTADRLFYLQGIRAVGVDTIAAEIGISKRTLYNHFPSKFSIPLRVTARPEAASEWKLSRPLRHMLVLAGTRSGFPWCYQSVS